MPKTVSKKVSVSLAPEYKIWKAVATESSRPVLTGVYLDPKGYMVAADGYLLAVVPCKIQGKLEEGVIIPTFVLSEAHKRRPKYSDSLPLLFIEASDNGVLISSAFGDGQITSRPIDGTYPAWRWQIPPLSEMMASTKQISYDPKLMLRLSEAIGITFPVMFLSKNVESHQYPAVVTGLDRALGLIMPMISLPVDRSVLVRIARLRVKTPVQEAAIEEVVPESSTEDTVPRDLTQDGEDVDEGG